MLQTSFNERDHRENREFDVEGVEGLAFDKGLQYSGVPLTVPAVREQEIKKRWPKMSCDVQPSVRVPPMNFTTKDNPGSFPQPVSERCGRSSKSKQKNH